MGDIDFAKTQIAHSRTFSAGSRCMTWLTFGTNTQTEHHLFPTVPFRYLPDITPIIQKVSEKHNVNFRKPYDGFLKAFHIDLAFVWYIPSMQRIVPRKLCIVSLQLSIACKAICEVMQHQVSQSMSFTDAMVVNDPPHILFFKKKKKKKKKKVLSLIPLL